MPTVSDLHKDPARDRFFLSGSPMNMITSYVLKMSTFVHSENALHQFQCIYHFWILYVTIIESRFTLRFAPYRTGLVNRRYPWEDDYKINTPVHSYGTNLDNGITSSTISRHRSIWKRDLGKVMYHPHSALLKIFFPFFPYRCLPSMGCGVNSAKLISVS